MRTTRTLPRILEPVHVDSLVAALRRWRDRAMAEAMVLGGLRRCGNEVTAHKPDPAVYLPALQRLNIRADEAIAFEDTPHGVAAAKAAGLSCVAIPNAFAAVSRFGVADLVLASAAVTTLDRTLARGWHMT